MATPDHDGPEVDLSLLKDSPFVLLKPGMRIRQVSEGLFKDAGIHKPNIILESESIGTLFELAVRGMASSLTHHSFIPRTYKGTYFKDRLPICFLRLNNPKAKSVLAAVYLKDRYLSKSAREFISLTEELLSNDKEVRPTKKADPIERRRILTLRRYREDEQAACAPRQHEPGGPQRDSGSSFPGIVVAANQD